VPHAWRRRNRNGPGKGGPGQGQPTSIEGQSYVGDNKLPGGRLVPRIGIILPEATALPRTPMR
jgi:hypothetical protein